MNKQIRFYFRFLVALITKYFPYLVFGAILSVVSFYSFIYLSQYLPSYRYTKTIAIIGKYSLTELPPLILSQISLGLTTIDNQGLPAPGIASSWDTTDNGKTYTFALNSQTRWQDKTAIASQDILYRFRDAAISYPDAQHIVFALKDPFSPLPTLLSRPVVKLIKPHLFSQTKILGVGEYAITSYKTNAGQLESLTLKPTHPQNRLPILNYRFYPSTNMALTAFKLGQVDTVDNLGDDPHLSGWPNSVAYRHILHDRYVGLFFNTQAPAFTGASGKNLRTAIAYAINKDQYTDRAYGPINPDSWAFNPDVKKFNPDATRAAELLKKVEKIPGKITLHTVPAYLPVAEKIQKDMAAIKITAEVLVTQEIPENFEALVIAQAIPIDPDQYNFWHSTQDQTNLTNLNSPRIDKLLEDGRKVSDLETRKKIYQDFQKYLAEEVPAVFLFYPPTYTLTQK